MKVYMGVYRERQKDRETRRREKGKRKGGWGWEGEEKKKERSRTREKRKNWGLGGKKVETPSNVTHSSTPAPNILLPKHLTKLFFPLIEGSYCRKTLLCGSHWSAPLRISSSKERTDKGPAAAQVRPPPDWPQPLTELSAEGRPRTPLMAQRSGLPRLWGSFLRLLGKQDASTQPPLPLSCPQAQTGLWAWGSTYAEPSSYLPTQEFP